MSFRTCVLRVVNGLDQYVPVEDAVIEWGEKVFVGDFRAETEKAGPSGSHLQTICLPTGKVHSLPLTCCHIGLVAPDRNWTSISGPMRNNQNERIFVSYRQHLDMCGAS